MTAMNNGESVSLLWSEYQETRSVEVRNQLIERYLSMVGHVVNRLKLKLPEWIDSGDLHSLGTLGLIEAVEKFEPERAFAFETYAPFRIQGKILDGLRDMDWKPRLVMSNAKKYRKAVATLQRQRGITTVPTVEEIATHLGIDSEAVECLRQDAFGMTVKFQQEGIRYENDDNNVKNHTVLPLNLLADHRYAASDDRIAERDNFDALVECLTQKERAVIILYYREELTMRAIGDLLDMSESRISQMHDEVLEKLRKMYCSA